MITYRELATAFRALDLERTTPVIVHASVEAFGPIHGGVDTLLGAILASFDTLLTPVFTYRTMLIPEVGPEDNGLIYGSGKTSNATAEFFRPEMPADRSMGILAESLRRLPQAERSKHPILSFAGINARTLLSAQNLFEPFGPVQRLQEAGGWVLLLGVEHTANASLHLIEEVSGRKRFVRWALTPTGVVECTDMPGCSRGFEAVEPRLRRITRQVQVGESFIKAVPLVDQAKIVSAWLDADPTALLCGRTDCASCQAVRRQIISV